MTQTTYLAQRKEPRLQPCPFCDHPLDAQWIRPNPKARCRTDGCKGSQLPVLNLDSPQDIAAWNTRAGRPADWTSTSMPTLDQRRSPEQMRGTGAGELYYKYVVAVLTRYRAMVPANRRNEQEIDWLRLRDAAVSVRNSFEGALPFYHSRDEAHTAPARRANDIHDGLLTMLDAAVAAQHAHRGAGC
ncbi:MAG: hypothetical protein E2591_26965 [Achromobacter sp.]|uniref:hypothetical protein n=1 Tax=Achromobacter sp. TaxID=134375 RepID=UPI0012C3A71D|nr:hypothetical protein [Achromobacter sp.]MPS81719.1 hypothetical protein [Achromobacter sp.]